MSVLFASPHARASSGVAKGTVVNANGRPVNPPAKSRRTTELPMTAAEYSGNNFFPPQKRFLVHSDRSPDDHRVAPWKHWASAYVCFVQRIEIMVCASPDGPHRRRRLSLRMRLRVRDRGFGQHIGFKFSKLRWVRSRGDQGGGYCVEAGGDRSLV